MASGAGNRYVWRINLTRETISREATISGERHLTHQSNAGAVTAAEVA
ncbi:MAG: hypothetical protein ACK58L_21980 [Planctomycetota bacterium]